MTQQIRLLPPDWQVRAPWHAKEARRVFMRRVVRAYQADHLVRTNRLPAPSARQRLAEAVNEAGERDGRKPRRVEVD